MTITEWDEKSYTFFTMQESLDRTNFSNKKTGDLFNVERCIRYGDRVDGHFVTGHIDTIGTVSEILENSDRSTLLRISFPKEYSSLIVEK
jgi:riboflavin synthase